MEGLLVHFIGGGIIAVNDDDTYLLITAIKNGDEYVVLENYYINIRNISYMEIVRRRR